MKTLTPELLRDLYSLLAVPMTKFNCGTLCAPSNKGIPECCDMRGSIPVLYAEEYRWLSRTRKFWKRPKLNKRDIKKLADRIDDDESFLCVCPGPANCDRSLRAIVCRIFPFEPHLDSAGMILGLTYNYTLSDRCPLIGKPVGIYNSSYIARSIKFWREFLKVYPDEQKMYRRESARLRRKFRKKGAKVPLFK